jgi:transposase
MMDKQVQRHMALLTKDIDEIETMMLELIESDERLSRQYRHITSIKGMGQINAVALIAITEGFTKYADNAKKLACHAGVAPFKKESGTSLRGPVHVSHLSNHTLKPLLTQAAWVAIRYTPNLRAYYQRLVEKGKKSQVALNNVKNKLIHIVIGLIRKDEDYTLSYCPVKKIYRII